MYSGSRPTLLIRNSTVLRRLSSDDLRRLGCLTTAIFSMSSEQPRVFFSNSILAASFSWVTQETVVSAYMNWPEPRGTPSSSARATSTWSFSGLQTITHVPLRPVLARWGIFNPQRRSSSTLGLTTVSMSRLRRAPPPRAPLDTALTNSSKEPNNGIQN
uniref:Uncharacterized protein n=1 Tax=Triticum urartu TaxID=4572 RepID=A0A8R7V3F2_TRIUA